LLDCFFLFFFPGKVVSPHAWAIPWTRPLISTAHRLFYLGKPGLNDLVGGAVHSLPFFFLELTIRKNATLVGL